MTSYATSDRALGSYHYAYVWHETHNGGNLGIHGNHGQVRRDIKSCGVIFNLQRICLLENGSRSSHKHNKDLMAAAGKKSRTRKRDKETTALPFKMEAAPISVGSQLSSP